MDRDAVVEFAYPSAVQGMDGQFDQLQTTINTKRKAADLGEGTAAESLSNVPGGPDECNTEIKNKSSCAD